MPRPRNVLMSMFAPGVISAEQASDALRQSGGDIQQAKQILQASIIDSKASKSTATSAKSNDSENVVNTLTERLPPRSVVSVNNLSDRQYCCVWHVEVFEDGYRPEVARALLARVARHTNPVLRERGWRVKRLIESCSRKFLGCCTTNGRDDADAASTNIQLNLRVQPSKHCKVFRTFEQIMSVMLHEITHTSIGLEDIHPPAFYELLGEIRTQYRTLLQNGQVAKETDDYGCNNAFVTTSGEIATVGEAASGIVKQDGDIPLFASNDECGAKKNRRRRWRGRKRSAGQAMGTRALQAQQKRRPLLKGAKMIDKRTKAGKAAMAQQAAVPSRELAARAALARFGGNTSGIMRVAAKKEEKEEENKSKIGKDDESSSASSDESDDDDEEDSIASHDEGCDCRSCEWEKMLEFSLRPATSLAEKKKESP